LLSYVLINYLKAGISPGFINLLVFS